MQTLDRRTYTPEEYLELEQHSETRYEYQNGTLVEMTGGTPAHNRITLNLCLLLNLALKGQPYSLFALDQRLWMPTPRLYAYPDVAIVRDPLQMQPGRTDTMVEPLLIAEIPSKSTRNYDRGDKFAAYRTISSFTEYLTLDQYAPHVEHYTKTDRGWLLRDYRGLDASFSLSAIALSITLADLYDKIDFATESPEQP